MEETDLAVLAAVTALKNDAQLTGANALQSAENIVPRASERAKQVPALTWFVVASTPLENTVTAIVQFDVRASSAARVAEIKKHVRRLLHYTNVTALNGLALFAQIEETREVLDEPGVIDHSIDVRLEPAKLRAA